MYVSWDCFICTCLKVDSCISKSYLGGIFCLDMPIIYVFLIFKVDPSVLKKIYVQNDNSKKKNVYVFIFFLGSLIVEPEVSDARA